MTSSVILCFTASNICYCLMLYYVSAIILSCYNRSQSEQWHIYFFIGMKTRLRGIEVHVFNGLICCLTTYNMKRLSKQKRNPLSQTKNSIKLFCENYMIQALYTVWAFVKIVSLTLTISFLSVVKSMASNLTKVYCTEEWNHNPQLNQG